MLMLRLSQDYSLFLRLSLDSWLHAALRLSVRVFRLNISRDVLMAPDLNRAQLAIRSFTAIEIGN